MKKYEILKEKYIEEVSSNVTLLKHIKSGAHILLFKNEDPNKVFSVGFRTPPTDDTGVPHILEHSTLCGSKKFPVKDPFIELLKSSLNTFLNAMTYPDKTVYPVASLNDHDFQNLMEVYMDAVFYPNVYLHEEIFKQEGWHYELDDVNGDLRINGVVYNEMKGAFSSPEQVVMRVSRHALFPDTPYGVESGGDPDFIPNLTYNDFLNFHRKYYSPSNSYIILYGNMNMEEKLQWMDEEYLSHFDKIDPNSDIEYQKSFTSPQFSEYYYPIGKEDSLENKTFYSYNAVIGTYKDVLLNYSFLVLNYILFVSPGSPVRQALLNAELGTDVLSEFDTGMLQTVLTLIVKGAKAGKQEQFKNVINETLSTLVKEGIDKKLLLSGINYYEFLLREADYGGAPTGLVYGLNAMGTWLYDENDPFSMLEFYDVFKQLKELVETNYFEELIDQYLLNNNHVAYVTVSPSNTLAEEKAKDLQNKLNNYRDSLTSEQKQKLVDDTKALKVYQETPSTPEELSTIPLLTKEDIDEKIELLPNDVSKICDIEVISHDINTKGISYIDFNFDITKIPVDLLYYVGLLNSVIGKVDTKSYNYDELSKEINIYTGGISTSVKVYPKKDQDFLAYFIFNTKALDENISYIFKFLNEIINHSRFDMKQRLKEILQERQSELQMYFMGSGHSAAVSRALSYINPMNNFNEIVDGISQYKFIEEICTNYDEKYEEVVENLQKVINYIFRFENLVISYTGQNQLYQNYIEEFINTFTKTEIEKEDFVPQLELLNEGFKTPSMVQYVARVGNFASVGNYTGAFLVFGMALRYDYLWMKVRVLGGAYGCMTNVSRNGNLYFVSYRDPNLEKTNEVFENVPNYLDSFNPTNEELTKYIIGAIGYLDTPLTPRSKGLRAFSNYLQNITNEDLQREREQVINVTIEDIKALKPLIEKALNDQAICTIGNENQIDASTLFKTKQNLMK